MVKREMPLGLVSFDGNTQRLGGAFAAAFGEQKEHHNENQNKDHNGGAFFVHNSILPLSHF